MNDALYCAYESCQGRLNASFSFGEFQKLMDGFEVIPVGVGGCVVGAILRNGPEIHACIKPEGFKRWFRKFAMSILDETIKAHGYAQTRVMRGNDIGISFVERLGFTFFKNEGDVIIYRKALYGR